MHLLIITCVSLILWILRPLPLTRLRVGVRTNWRKKGVGPVLSIILSQHLPLPLLPQYWTVFSTLHLNFVARALCSLFIDSSAL